MLRKLIASLGVLAVTVALAACWNSNDYWYCWDTGAPKPHHLGYPVEGDHLCTDKELEANPPG